MAENTKETAKPKTNRHPVLVQLRERLAGHGAWTRDIEGQLLPGGALVAIKDMAGVEHWYPVSVASRIDPRVVE